MTNQELDYKLNKQIDQNDQLIMGLSEKESLIRINRNLEKQVAAYQQDKINLQIQYQQS